MPFLKLSAVLEAANMHSSFGWIEVCEENLRGASVKQCGVEMKLCLAEGILPQQPVLGESVSLLYYRNTIEF